MTDCARLIRPIAATDKPDPSRCEKDFWKGHLLVHPLSKMRLLWVWSVTRGTGPGWGGCDDPSGARIERGGGAQAGADDALTEAGRRAGPPGADYPARG